jgi:hypothetical protein
LKLRSHPSTLSWPFGGLLRDWPICCKRKVTWNHGGYIRCHKPAKHKTKDNAREDLGGPDSSAVCSLMCSLPGHEPRRLSTSFVHSRPFNLEVVNNLEFSIHSPSVHTSATVASARLHAERVDVETWNSDASCGGLGGCGLVRAESQKPVAPHHHRPNHRRFDDSNSRCRSLGANDHVQCAGSTVGEAVQQQAADTVRRSVDHPKTENGLQGTSHLRLPQFQARHDDASPGPWDARGSRSEVARSLAHLLGITVRCDGGK